MRVVVAPVPGMIQKVLTTPGGAVRRGDILFELLVMGMIQKVPSPVNGDVRLLLVGDGEQVVQGQLLAELNVALGADWK